MKPTSAAHCTSIVISMSYGCVKSASDLIVGAACAEQLQIMIQAHGGELLLQSNGFRVPRRVILFSRPSAIYACKWLFEEQGSLHDGFRNKAAELHEKAADMLMATIGQLVCHLSWLLN